MAQRTLFVLLLAVNTAIAWALFRPTPEKAPVETATTENNANRPVYRALTQDPIVPPKAFHWSDVESQDYKEYIAKLRAIKCPEETIRDIIVADVNKLFEKKSAALKLKPEHRKPWEILSYEDSLYSDLVLTRRKLHLEKKNLIRELLGIELNESFDAPGFEGMSAFEAALQHVPEDKRHVVRAIKEEASFRHAELMRRTMGDLEPEDQQEYLKIEQEARDQMAKLLNPRELEDLLLRTSPLANSMSYNLSAFEPSEQEFRTIFQVQDKFESQMRLLSNTPEDRQLRSKMRADMEAEVMSILGKNRFQDYKLSQDYRYRTIYEVARDSGIPSANARKAYDVQNLAIEELRNVNAVPDLSPEDRAHRLQQAQQEMDAALQQLLGNEGYARYQRNGGYRIYSPPRAATATVRFE